MNDPLDWIDAVTAERARLGLIRKLAVPDPALIDFASNDYLGLAADPRLISAAHEAALQYGWGATAAPLVRGWKPPHEELVDALARFEQAEAVALFPTGFAANLGAVVSLVGAGDAIYADRLCHASLIEGARLSGARLRVYPHADAERLSAILKRERPAHRRVLILTDGVFSMDGDLAPLVDLTAIAERFGAMLLVDEAHGTGVFGPDGRGAASALGLAERVPIKVGTLSKALGSLGGFVAGSRRLIDHIINHAPPFIYSTGLPPAAAAAAREALRIVQDEPERRERLLRRSGALAAALRSNGFQTGNANGPIIPIRLGESQSALAAAERLRAAGLLVPAIRPPTVPRGTARLRISVTAAHTETDLAGLADNLCDPSIQGANS